MSRYPANIITKSPATPTGPNPITGRAPGVWRMEDVAYWLKQGVWPDASADGYWPYVSLLLSSTSLSNANNNLFVDSSGAFNPVSRNGNTTQGSFSPYGSYWSNYFDGSGDYLTAPANAAFQLTGDFTVEAWIYPTAINTIGMIFGSENGAPSDYLGITSTRLVMAISAPSSPSYPEWSYTFALNQWYHVAVTRSGSTLRAFVNGTQLTLASGSATNSQQFFVSGVPVSIGRYGYTTSPYYFVGNISNVRIVKGTAVYTADFTPPTAPLTAISGTSLLTCQSNRFIDNSSNAFTITVNGDTKVQKFSPFTLAAPGVSYNQSDITNWSGYFDGSGDYLRVPSNAVFAFGTGDWTIEFWVYVTNTASDMAFVDLRTSGGSIAPMVWMTGGVVYYYTNYSNQITGSALTANTWTHIAVARSGTSTKLFVNGAQAGSTLSDSYNYVQSPVSIGSFGNAAVNFLSGYMSNVRIVKGTAVYTSNFTPPTSNLTAISGTSLLTCQNAAFTDNSTNNFVITQNGNPTVTGNSPFNTTGYWSNYFDGSGDYLSGSSWSSAGNFGTGAFTVECWVYATGAPQSNQVIWSCNSYPNTTGLYLQYAGSGATQLNVATGGTTLITASAGWAFNQWIHVAVVRSGTTLTLYINGVSRGSTTFSNNCTDGLTFIGRPSDIANYMMQGYISNFRIVKGTAVYTGAFTPPTTPLTAISGTSLLTCQNGRFIDNSTNAYAITVNGDTSIQPYNPFYTATIASNGGSMYFDGSGDYLFLPSSPNFTFGTGNFTIEFWLYLNSVSGIQIIYDNRPSAGNYPVIYMNGSTLIYYTNSADRITSSALLTATWYHVAVSRSGTSTKMFVNGTQAGSTFTDSTNYLQAALRIGADYIPSNYLNGYINGLRVTNGTALYTAAFTPPTAPVTPTAATTLLLNGMNAGIYDATAINDMETVGNAQVSTVQSKFGGSSMYFDGTGDTLTAPPNPALALGTGQFTVEMWMYWNAVTNIGEFACCTTTGSGGCFTFYYSGGSLQAVATGGAGATTGSWTPSTGQWYHVAATRDASNVQRIFINGTLLASSTSTNNYGQNGFTMSYNNSFNGYIDDLRITKGVARYTANFTPPTQAFPVY